MGAGSRVSEQAFIITPDLDWSVQRVVVAGAGVTGKAVAHALARRGATVHVVDQGLTPGSAVKAEFETAGFIADDDELGAVVEASLMVVSPGWRPDAPVMKAAETLQVPILGELDVAWILQQQRGQGPAWLTLTGTNGKTTAVTMAESMLLAAGRRALAVGNVGRSIVEAIDAQEPYEVLALELSSFQLHRSHLMRPFASAVLNITPDHLDWHGDFAAYRADKARILERTTHACIYRAEEPITRQLIEQADVEEGCRAIGTTLGIPALGEIGVVDGLILDRAFEDNRREEATELAGVDDLVDQAAHTIANALSATALVRSTGVDPSAIRQGLRDWQPQPHRMTVVATIDEVTWVDDSKATNPHAAAASLASFDDIVWIAGGLAKGAEFDELVTRAASRLRAVIVLGTDRDQVVAAVKRHAPDVPVIDVDDAENGAVNLMQAAVEAARRHAVAGSTVLLAPACASMDRFRDYHERGQLFADIVVRNQS